MTVKELITILKAFNENKEIKVDSYSEMIRTDICSVELDAQGNIVIINIS